MLNMNKMLVLIGVIMAVTMATGCGRDKKKTGNAPANQEQHDPNANPGNRNEEPAVAGELFGCAFPSNAICFETRVPASALAESTQACEDGDGQAVSTGCPTEGRIANCSKNNVTYHVYDAYTNEEAEEVCKALIAAAE